MVTAQFKFRSTNKQMNMVAPGRVGWGRQGMQATYHFGRVFPEEPSIQPVATWVSRT